MKELFRFLGMLISFYISASLLYTAIEEHVSLWLVPASMWVWIGLRIFPVFRQKTEDDNQA